MHQKMSATIIIAKQRYFKLFSCTLCVGKSWTNQSAKTILYWNRNFFFLEFSHCTVVAVYVYYMFVCNFYDTNYLLMSGIMEFKKKKLKCIWLILFCGSCKLKRLEGCIKNYFSMASMDDFNLACFSKQNMILI
jgi:hypothetical protein